MKNKIKNAIIGFVVGDAFGVPYEFKPKNCLFNKNMIGYGTWNQPIGTFSDDTSMMWATLDAINENGRNTKLSTIVKNFLAWKNENKFTAHDEVFDIGNRTNVALNYYEANKQFLLDKNNAMSNGNGSLMRILPLAFIDDVTNEAIDMVSSITHSHKFSLDCCRIYVKLIRWLLNNDYDDALFIEEIIKLNEENDNILNIDDILKNDCIGSMGYVVTTLETALWAILHFDSYENVIHNVVNLGGDTDTNAAIAGAMAGIIYDDIPNEWIKNVTRLDDVLNSASTFISV